MPAEQGGSREMSLSVLLDVDSGHIKRRTENNDGQVHTPNI